MRGGSGQEGGYVGGIYIRCKGPSQLLREHRQEWEVGILRDINWLGWTGFGKWPTFDVKQWIGIWILPWFWTIYGHEGVWRVSSGVGLGRWQNDGVCRAPPRPTANVHGDYQQWIIGGGVALTEGGLGSLLCIRRFVHELWIQIAGLCMSLNGQRLPNNLLFKEKFKSRCVFRCCEVYGGFGKWGGKGRILKQWKWGVVKAGGHVVTVSICGATKPCGAMRFYGPLCIHWAQLSIVSFPFYFSERVCVCVSMTCQKSYCVPLSTIRLFHIFVGTEGWHIKIVRLCFIF